MIFANIVKQVETLVKENTTTILTGVGVAGTVATAVLTGRAGYRSALFIEEYYDCRISERRGDNTDSEIVEVDLLTVKEQAKLVWKFYIPPVGVGLLTITSIIMANRISSRQVAAIAAAYGISERRFHDYKEKVTEKIGANKETAVRDELAQDQVNNTLGSEVIITSNGNVLCFDLFTGRYFESTMESIKRAENRINEELLNTGYASMSEFYAEIGLPATTLSDTMGWNQTTNGLLDIQFSTIMSKDDRPCIAIDFGNAPINDYSRDYS